MKISYECSEIIEELKADVMKFGSSEPCFAIWKKCKFKIPFSENFGEVNLLVNYLLDIEETPSTEELEGGVAVVSTLGEVLKIFEEENKII